MDISASKLRSGYDTELSRHLSTRRRLFFHSLVGISQTLSTVKGKYLPSCIIAGVISTDRTRDFTPTASAAGRSGKTSPGTIPQGGGSETFSRFLTEELRSVIDSTYRTNGLNMLIGHSYSGLFTVNTFLRHTELFDIYLALDPSLWWDQGKLAEEAASLIQGKDFTGKSLYIGVASQNGLTGWIFTSTRSTISYRRYYRKLKNCNFLVNHFPKKITERSQFREYTTG